MVKSNSYFYRHRFKSCYPHLQRHCQLQAVSFLIPKYAREVAGCQSARKELPVVDPVGGKFTV